jgi:hypothetical protein
MVNNSINIIKTKESLNIKTKESLNSGGMSDFGIVPPVWYLFLPVYQNVEFLFFFCTREF